MQLSVGKWLKTDPVSYCPQHADMLPREMIVRDLISFACNLANVDLNDYRDCLRSLGIDKLMNQTIGTLSGGQIQRVNICAAIIQPTPSVIFLDEPFAALDEENVLHCLAALKMLPLKHSFVITLHVDPSSYGNTMMFDRIIHLDCKRKNTFEEVHNNLVNEVFSDDVSDSSSDITFGNSMIFDRIIDLDCKRKNTFREVQNNLDEVFSDDISGSSSDNNRSQFRGCINASFILWFGQFYGTPLLEGVLLICTTVGAILAGSLARRSTAEWSDYLPTSEGMRLPSYMADIIVALCLITSFGGSLMYARREREIINHFVTIRAMDPLAYLLTCFVFRCIVHGTLQAGLWVFIFLPILELPLNNSFLVFVTCAIFGFSWAGITFAVAFLCPKAYAAHILMVLNMIGAFFSGVFFIWSRLYETCKALHYANPLFYTISAISYMVLNNFDAGCSETQHPGKCASGTRLLEMADVVQWSRLEAQGVSILFGTAAFMISFYKLHRLKQASRKGYLSRDPKIISTFMKHKVAADIQIEQSSPPPPSSQAQFPRSG